MIKVFSKTVNFSLFVSFSTKSYPVISTIYLGHIRDNADSNIYGVSMKKNKSGRCIGLNGLFLT